MLVTNNDYIQADETTVQVLKEPGKKATARAGFRDRRAGRSLPAVVKQHIAALWRLRRRIIGKQRVGHYSGTQAVPLLRWMLPSGNCMRLSLNLAGSCNFSKVVGAAGAAGAACGAPGSLGMFCLAKSAIV